jgi:dihydropteroate synthase
MKKTLNIAGKLIDLSRPQVMGILNITPDSFFEGSRFGQVEAAVARAAQMQHEGATFIDIGGHSTRPGADAVSEAEELDRVLPVVAALHQNLPDLVLSIDTFRASVARQAVAAGAHIINDISGGNLDDDMFETVAQLNVPYVLMHSRGTPQTMQQLTHYEYLVSDVIRELQQKVAQLRALNVKDIVIDPGFGFAKTADQNFELVQHLEAFQMLDCPLLIGLSRKSMIWRTLNTTAAEALNGTTVLNTVALTKGANILRVHDVRPAVEAIALLDKLGLFL